MNEQRIHSRYGPGGRFCTCCGPAPRHRKSHDRSVKRSLNNKVKKEVQKEINAHF